jgi:hypothetical protein
MGCLMDIPGCREHLEIPRGAVWCLVVFNSFRNKEPPGPKICYRPTGWYVVASLGPKLGVPWGAVCLPKGAERRPGVTRGALRCPGFFLIITRMGKYCYRCYETPATGPRSKPMRAKSIQLGREASLRLQVVSLEGAESR